MNETPFADLTKLRFVISGARARHPQLASTERPKRKEITPVGGFTFSDDISRLAACQEDWWEILGRGMIRKFGSRCRSQRGRSVSDPHCFPLAAPAPEYEASEAADEG